MKLSYPFLMPLLVAYLASNAAAFVASNKIVAMGRTDSSRVISNSGQSGGDTQQSTTTSLQMMLPYSDMIDSANNLWIATIDADIDSIPTNEFGTVFAGGIVVMLGGVLSALMVGFILERGDLYANVVADSYAQGAEDEEFWKGLSDEEKKKTQEMLRKIKEAKEGGPKPAAADVQPVQEASAAEEEIDPEASSDTPESTQSKKVDMFSDYD